MLKLTREEVEKRIEELASEAQVHADSARQHAEYGQLRERMRQQCVDARAALITVLSRLPELQGEQGTDEPRIEEAQP